MVIEKMSRITNKKRDALGMCDEITPLVQSAEIENLSPVDLYEKLCAEEEYSFLLESMEGEEKIARYSILGFDPFLHFQSKGDCVTISMEEKTMREQGDPIDLLKSLVSRIQMKEPNIPVRFFSGGVGYFSYDMVRFFEALPDSNPDELDIPDCYFLFPRIVVIFDYLLQSLHMIYNGTSEENDQGREALEAVAKTVEHLKRQGNTTREHRLIDGKPTDLQSNLSQAQFERMVERAREYILAGDVFQVVLSQRFSLHISSDPVDIFRVLRTTNPSPYMYYLNFSHLRIIGSSPEILVRVEDGLVETRPLAGTRPRGDTPKMDDELTQELRGDEKERAEHIMLVDLGRNDIGRVCEYGNVAVTKLLDVEKYSHVMHLVSNVVGKLRRDRDVFDVLRATFPAGTVSGAPKVRAMEIIDELEPTRRGIYAGAIGYVSFAGNLDTCIAIRTIVVKDDTAFIQAGAGIVADSVPEREYQETLDKAHALLRAIECAHAGLDRGEVCKD